MVWRDAHYYLAHHSTPPESHDAGTEYAVKGPCNEPHGPCGARGLLFQFFASPHIRLKDGCLPLTSLCRGPWVETLSTEHARLTIGRVTKGINHPPKVFSLAPHTERSLQVELADRALALMPIRAR